MDALEAAAEAAKKAAEDAAVDSQAAELRLASVISDLRAELRGEMAALQKELRAVLEREWILSLALLICISLLVTLLLGSAGVLSRGSPVAVAMDARTHGIQKPLAKGTEPGRASSTCTARLSPATLHDVEVSGETVSSSASTAKLRPVGRQLSISSSEATSMSHGGGKAAVAALKGHVTGKRKTTVNGGGDEGSSLRVRKDAGGGSTAGHFSSGKEGARLIFFRWLALGGGALVFALGGLLVALSLVNKDNSPLSWDIGEGNRFLQWMQNTGAGWIRW